MDGGRAGAPAQKRSPDQAAAVVALVERSVPELYRYAVRLTGGERAQAEDLVQEACLALARAAGEVGVDVEDLGVGWLVVVVRRRFLDDLRRDRREQERLVRLGPVEDVHEPDWSAIDGAEALEALGHLEGARRAALILRYVDDLPVRQVADLLDRSVSATESLLARARRQLAHHLGGAHRG